MATTSATTLPCLVLDHGTSQPTTAFCVSDCMHRACDVEELRGKLSWPTSSGWVLSWDPVTTATLLWNPSSAPGSDQIALPPMAHPPPVESVCALSCLPTATGVCTVVLIEPPETATALWYCHITGAAASTMTWTRHDYDVGGSSVPVPEGEWWCKRVISRLAPCRGKFYYFHSATEFGVIDFSPAGTGPPVFSTVPMKKVPIKYPDGQFMAMASMYYLDMDGELYTVCVVHYSDDVNSVAEISVYRMDFEVQEPIRVDNIGNRAILAGSSSPFGGWNPATEFGLLPNSVYWMSPVDKRLHVFEIATGKKEVKEPCKGVAEPSRQPFWMVPEHS